MFTKLKIKNFQSIKNAELELGGITVINGPSNLGKSAVVRALNTLIHNSYQAAYMKHGASKMEVSIYEGEKFVRYLRDTTTKYEFSEKGEHYSKIGRTVPEEISKFFNMSPIIFDTDLELDFNFQNQFDKPFVIDSSGFEIAKIFGKLMNLELVLSSTKEIVKDQMGINKKKEGLQLLSGRVKDHLSANSFVEKQYFLLQDIKVMEEDFLLRKSKLDKIQSILIQLEESNKKKEFAEKKLEILSKENLEDTSVNLSMLGNLIVLEEVVERKLSFFDKFNSLISSVKLDDSSSILKLQNLMDLISCMLVSSKKIDFLSNKLDKFQVLEETNIETLVNLKEQLLTADKINFNYKSLVNSLKSTNANIELVSKEFALFVDGLDICPITGLLLSPECKANLKEEV